MKNEKKIHFYKLNLTTGKQINLFENLNMTFETKISAFIKNHNESDLSQHNDNNILTIISIDETHIFGTFGNVSDISEGDHSRGRNREDLTIEEINNLLEIYTFYYLDIQSMKIAVLQNSKLIDFKEPFKNFISSHFRISALYETISVIPLLSDLIPSKIGEKAPLLSVKAKYSDDRLPDNEFLTIKEITGIKNDDISSISINISLKKDNKSWSINSFKKDDYSEFKMETEKDSIDLVQGLITKKAFIDINKEDLIDQDIIKDELKQSLADIL